MTREVLDCKFSLLPGLEWSDTDELVYSLHFSCYRCCQLLFINIGTMTPKHKPVRIHFLVIKVILGLKSIRKPVQRLVKTNIKLLLDDFLSWQHSVVVANTDSLWFKLTQTNISLPHETGVCGDYIPGDDEIFPVRRRIC